MTAPRVAMLVGALLFMPVPLAFGERATQAHSEADLVITGVVRKIIAHEASYGIDGIKTYYEAEVVVDGVERGDGANTGDTVRVEWFCVTKPPKQALFDAYGCDYGIQEKDLGRFWLEKSPPSPFFKRKWTLLYNSGFEHLEKAERK